MARRKQITAQEALREAYAVNWDKRCDVDTLAREFAVKAMVRSGHDRDIAEAAVIAAFNAHFKIAGAV